MANDGADGSVPGAKPAEAVLRAHLDPREAVLWTGRPVPLHAAWAGFPGGSWLARGLYLALGVAAMTPLSLAGAYVAWTSAKAIAPLDSIAAILGAPLLLGLGLVLAVAPWYLLLRPRLRNLRNARDIRYVITDRRALVVLIRDGAVVDEHETPLHAMAPPRLRFLRRDGSGDVIFATGGGWSSHEDVGFIGVCAAGQVLGILRHAMDEAPGSPRAGET